MSRPTEHTLLLPFVLAGRHLFSVPLRVSVQQASLAQALGGGAGELVRPPLGQGDGVLVKDLPDPGCRTFTLGEDRVSYVLERDVWRYLALTDSYERFLSARYSPKTQESFAQDEARFREQFGAELDLREYQSPGEVAEFSTLVRQMKAEGVPSAACDEDVDLAACAQEAGMVHGFILFAHQVPVAYLCLLSQGETLHYVCSGEREEYRQWSVGALVHLNAFRRMFADPRYHYMDFRPGDCKIKRQFSNGALRSATVLHLRRTWRNRLLVWLYSLTTPAQARGAHVDVPEHGRVQLA